MIITRNLFPVVGGLHLKTYHLIQLLSRKYDINLIIISHLPLCEEEENFYKTYTADYKYFRFPKWRFLLNAFRGIFSQKPIQVHYYYFRKINKKFCKLAQDSDIIIGTLIRSMFYLNHVPQTKFKILDMIDSIGLNYRRSQQHTKSKFWKIIYWIEGKRLMKFEKTSIQNCNITFFVNQQETQYWKNVGNCVWTPMGVKECLFEYNKISPEYSHSIAFFGKMNYQPNIDAVLWFVKNVLPLLPETLEFIIVGSSPTSVIRELSRQCKNIKITGFVEDPYLILNSCLAIVAPMQTGGGVQNKVLETMALGKVNILSSLAADPIIGAIDKIHFYKADQPEEYSFYIQQIIKTTNSEIGNNAQKLMREQYSLKNYFEVFTNTIESLQSVL